MQGFQTGGFVGPQRGSSAALSLIVGSPLCPLARAWKTMPGKFNPLISGPAHGLEESGSSGNSVGLVGGCVVMSQSCFLGFLRGSSSGKLGFRV